MDVAEEKDQVFQDFTTLLQAFLPQAVGLQCHDKDGGIFWQDRDQRVEFSAEYDQRLAEVLKSPEKAGAIGRVPLANVQAYLAPLTSSDNVVLGILTIFVDKSADGMNNAFCIELLTPVLRTLQRELNLRFKLVDGARKLAIQAAEEALLHQVETIVHQRASYDAALSAVLRSCRRLITIEHAALVIPNRSIRIVQGSDNAEEMVRRFEEAFDQPTTELGEDIVALDENSDFIALSINHGSRRGIGYVALSGWKKSNFSNARRRRVLRYIAFQIETVLKNSYDELTGLMTWPAFERKLIEVAGGASDSELDDYTVMFLDLDRLHVTNEAFGRDLGDQILAEFASIIRRYLEGHALTRIASDSFGVLMSDTNRDQAKFIAERICDEVKLLEYVRGGQTCRPSVSIGIGPLTKDPKNGNAALSTAQVACNAAKDRGRGRVEVYRSVDESMIRRFDDMQMVGEIRGAIDSNRMLMVAQPIMPLQGQTDIRYFEVLVRLIDDQGRQIPPSEFFSSAERYQLMEELDRWVIRSTLQSMANYIAKTGDTNLRLAINLSGQSLGSEPFLGYVKEQLIESRVSPSMLCFELTETVAIANVERAQHFMEVLKKLGCRFSLDDFGTGLSSFAYLKQFNVDALKIDGSFIKDVASNKVSQSVVTAITEIARTMKLETVAEFVQDEKAFELLRSLGVHWAQGFLTGAPLPLDEQLQHAIETSPTVSEKPNTQIRKAAKSASSA